MVPCCWCSCVLPMSKHANSSLAEPSGHQPAPLPKPPARLVGAGSSHGAREAWARRRISSSVCVGCHILGVLGLGALSHTRLATHLIPSLSLIRGCGRSKMCPRCRLPSWKRTATSWQRYGGGSAQGASVMQLSRRKIVRPAGTHKRIHWNTTCVQENPDLFKWLTNQLPTPEHLQRNEAYRVGAGLLVDADACMQIAFL